MYQTTTRLGWWAGQWVPESRWAMLAGGLLLGLLLGTAGTVTAEARLRQILAPAPEQVATIEFPQRVLPLEWRGGRPDLNLDHMFRKRR